jgi:branched-subunit amino acid ABC-type transport system permease component
MISGRFRFILFCVGLIVSGLLAIAGAASPLSYGLERHWNMADSIIAYLGTVQTYAVEIWIETDFIGQNKTLLAWFGLLLVVYGMLGLISILIDPVDRVKLQEEDHGTAQ